MFLHSFIKKIGYALAAIIIVSAVIVIVVRLITPVLDHHRADFEKLTSQYLHMPVTINKVRVSWYQYQPVIRFTGVTLLDKATQRPLLQVRTVNLLFSIPQSLWQRKVVTTGIVVSGTQLNIQETARGEYRVENFPALSFNKSTQGDHTQLKAALGFILMQPELALNHIDITYKDLQGDLRTFTLSQFNVENTGAEHTLSGQLVEHQTLPTELTLSAKWYGNSLDPAQMKAEVYLYVSGLSAAQWLQGQTWHGWQIQDGLLSAKIWAHWNLGTWQSIQGQFQSYGLVLYSLDDHSIHKINRFSGNLGWKWDGDTQYLAGDDLLIDLPQHLWPATHFNLSLTTSAEGRPLLKAIDVGYMDLSDVQGFLTASPQLLPETLQKALTGLQLRGEVQNFSMGFLDGLLWVPSGPVMDWNKVSLYAEFNRLGFAAWEHYPGISGLTGNVKWNGMAGEASINSQDTGLDYGQIFANKIELSQLSGTMQFHRGENKSWLLVVPAVQAANPDLSVNANGTIVLLDGALPTTDLQADFTLHQAAHITRYLPMQIFKPNLVQWLNSAFLAGEVTSGHAELRGKLADFPFDRGGGLFEITGKAKQVNLQFAPDWPLVQQVNGTLTFIGRQVMMDVDHAETLGATASQVHGNISNLGGGPGGQPPVLQIATDNIQTDFAQGLHYIHASPLEKILGNIFSTVAMQGPITLKLGLTVPLHAPDKTQVSGVINMKDSQMRLAQWDLNLEKLNGQANFTEKTLEAKNLRALLFDKPVQFSLTTKPKAKNQSMVQVNFTHHFQIKDIENWKKWSLSPLAQGGADVIGSIDLSFDQPIAIHLRSNLIGTTINLANQYGKPSQEARDTIADIFVKEGSPLQMNLSYADLLHLHIMSLSDDYEVEVHSPDVVGRVTIPAQFNRQSVITAQLQKLYLRTTGPGSAKMVLNAKTMPGLSFLANDVSYDDKPLGQVIFKALPSDQGMSIQTLRILSPRMDLHATGSWEQRGKEAVTHLYGSASSSEVTTLLNSLGLNASNFITNTGSLDFDLIWQGLPFIPSLANMDGRISLTVGEGRIVHIGSSNSAKMDIGRMLSIFSLQSIPRRLTLDFSDVFEKGYSFDSVKGDFSMQKGDLYTKNLRFDGPVAKVSINGRIGLVKKDYDLILGVTAHMTSSIPVAATVLTGIGTINPLIGLGAVAVNTVLGSKISNVTANYYSVTGSWDNPSWKPVR